VIREVKLFRKKLLCECNDDVFAGIPCRHLIATVSKDKDLSFENLKFEQRWRIDFFIDTESFKEPALLEEIKEDGEELIEITTVF